MDRPSSKSPRIDTQEPIKAHPSSVVAWERSVGRIADLDIVPFKIHSVSSYSAAYHPNNMLVDRPGDQSSRWSSENNTQPQYVILELLQPAIVKEIIFGKFEKPHVCNLKELRVYGGLELQTITQPLLTSGLRNDTEPEALRIHAAPGSVGFPSKYIKIVPLVAWGQSFNFSIWYVQLRGVTDPDTVAQSVVEYTAEKEREALRLCLKHFRRHNYAALFSSLKQQSAVSLEAPVVEELFEVLVGQGDFAAAERLVMREATHPVLDEYIRSHPYVAQWELIRSLDEFGHVQTDAATPGVRGGHQMCLDEDTGIIYLLGGWDGTEDLSDFWEYDIERNTWRLLAQDTAHVGGPGACSCHKMCLNEKTKQLFVLGKYVEVHGRPSDLTREFYCYDIAQNTWRVISKDTHADGGPDLIYDHQMVIDVEHEVIYVFGGRNLSVEAMENRYSGLYSYHIPTNKWRVLRPDMVYGKGYTKLMSRVGHSMLFNKKQQQLYILAGQRHQEYLNDFYIYDIANDVVSEVSRDTTKEGGPDPTFTQRATIDEEQGEVYVLSGLEKKKEGQRPDMTRESIRNSLWVYDVRAARWSSAYQQHVEDPAMVVHERGPCPRFAHQLVYHSPTKTHYLFGGNPGDPANQKLRLRDFWSLKLARPTQDEILRKAQMMIRKQHFMELCHDGKSKDALFYLRTTLMSNVGEEESDELHALAANIFKGPSSPTPEDKAVAQVSGIAVDLRYKSRNALFEELIKIFPKNMKQPEENLTELV